MKNQKAALVRNKILKTGVKSALMIVAGAVCGLFLLFAVYCLPVEPMKEHVWQSLPMIERDFQNSEIITGFPAAFTGNFTDCLMLENSIYDSKEHSVLEQILYMYRGESGTGAGWASGMSLVDYCNGKEQPREVEYARYWHGYLVVLKPLLLLTTFNSIRVLAAILQLILTGAIVMQCSRRNASGMGMAFLLSVSFLYFFSLYFSLSLSICFYVLAAAVLVQLKWHERLESRGWYGGFFLIVGMATAYFDFLTYPLVTLGFPLCFALYFSRTGWRGSLKKIICFSVQWGAGYMGLWAMKWVLTDILTGGSIIADALGTLAARTDTAQGHSAFSGFWTVLMKNISPYQNWPFYLLIFGIVLWLGRMLWKERTRLKNKGQVLNGLLTAGVAVYPFIWFFFTQNHSEEHWMFTFKIFSVSIFAVICSVLKMTQEEKELEKKAEGGKTANG